MNKLCVALLLLTLASVAWSATIEGRIIGGSPAAAGQFPHQVSLRSSANAHFCSGFIYNSRWVVSMAHCTSGRTTANTIAVVGAHTPTDGTSHAIVTIRNHPNYNANTKVNDISVLQTATEIVMNARVSPIPLGSVTVGVVDAVSSGWGFTSFPGSLAAELRFVNTQTLTNVDCQSRLTVGDQIMIVENKICTFVGQGVGNCSGDSGNPLISGGTVIGAASWNVGCAAGSPDVYSRISSHRAWIISETE